MAEQEQTIFRKKTLERISSPDQLNDYLRVTTPGIWVILSAVILLLLGLFAWAAVGTLETKVPARAVVEENSAKIIPYGSESLEKGMPVRINSNEYTLNSTDSDEYGRTFAYSNVDLPDGSYDAVVITEQIHPINFLLNSN